MPGLSTLVKDFETIMFMLKKYGEIIGLYVMLYI
jgi:hypothetical protein